MDGANLETSSNTKPKNKGNEKSANTPQNRDIRSFFNKSSGPSTLTTNKRIIQVIQPYINDIDESNYKLRERKIINYKTKFELSEDSNEDEDKKNSDDENSFSQDISDKENGDLDNNSGEDDLGSTEKKLKNKKRKANLLKKSNKNKKKQKKENNDENPGHDSVEGISEEDSMGESDIDNISDIDYIELRGAKSFQKFRSEAIQTIHEAEIELKRLTKEFYINEHKISETKSKYPDKCIPVCADIREFKFKNLAEKQMELTGQLFDIIMMDPPWQLSSSQPTRGVAIAYDTLNDSIITDIPVPKLQTDGFIFIWTINAKFKVTLDLIKQWGYRYLNKLF
jgi:mRNA m6A methyltransferase catalytic subunit